MDPNIFTISTFLTLFVASECQFQDRRWLPVQERVSIPGQNMAAGARDICDIVIFVILAGVSATSRKWRSRWQFHVLTTSVLHLG